MRCLNLSQEKRLCFGHAPTWLVMCHRPESRNEVLKIITSPVVFDANRSFKRWNTRCFKKDNFNKVVMMRCLYLNIFLKEGFCFWHAPAMCFVFQVFWWCHAGSKCYISGSIWRKWMFQTVKCSIIKNMLFYLSCYDAPYIFSNFSKEWICLSVRAGKSFA